VTRAKPTTEAKRADDALVYVVTSSPFPTGRRPDWPTVHGVLRSSFPSEHEARQVFIEMRLRRDIDWAELVALDGRGSVKRIAWFGPDGELQQPQPTKEHNMQTTQSVPETTLGENVPPRRHTRRRRLIATAALAVVCAGGIVAKSSVHSSGTPSLRASTTTFSGVDAPREGVDGPVVPRQRADSSSQVPNTDPAFAGGTGDVSYVRSPGGRGRNEAA
jgi:hypothetical protein